MSENLPTVDDFLCEVADIVETQGDGTVRYIGPRVEPVRLLVTALRARVAEMEGALRRVVQVADNTAGAFPDEVQEKDEYRRGQVRGAMDAARPARALLPAPAPGRDTGGTDAPVG